MPTPRLQLPKQLFWLILTLAVVTLAAEDDGKRLYLSQCGPCHGADGSGGRGPSLNRQKLVHAPDDDALYRVIRYGIAGTEMPRTWLSPEKIRAVAGHVRVLGRVTQPPLPGDPARGRAAYGESGCAACHTIAGHGGALGPDLDSIGASRSAGDIKLSLQSPNAHVTPGYSQVRAITTTGDSVVGVVVAESTFSVQIRDASARVHSFVKNDLGALEQPQPRSLMPPYTGHRLDDLVAYLAGLGGSR